MIIEYPPLLLQQAEDLLKGHHLTGFVAGQGPKHPKIMLIGEAPGREEAKTGVPFVGASGKELMKLIEEYLHMTREDVYIREPTADCPCMRYSRPRGRRPHIR